MSTQSFAPTKRSSLQLVRARTLQLFDLATSEDVLRTEPMTGFRPLLWHLAHIGVYQNYWVLQRCAGQSSINRAYDVHFDPIQTPREEAKTLPSRDEIEDYLSETLRRVENFLAGADLEKPTGKDALRPSYVLDLVLEHEMQHQETIAFVFQALPLSSKKPGRALEDGARAEAAAEILIPAAQAMTGAVEGSFAYDNELPRHWVDLAQFFIDRDLTTNREYEEFVENGGYERREYWSDEGWSWKGSANITAPLYWSERPRKERTFFAEAALRADAPVTGVSWYEAQAYAAFRDKRLPSEPEWEVAASWDPTLRRMRRFPWGDEQVEDDFAVNGRTTWGTSIVGTQTQNASALGLHDVVGNLWQWTASPFRGYDGFAPYPYPEYSQTWFDGDHYVSRGGSWFTDRSLARTSFRNFYRRHFRPAFLGIRCARDAR